MSTNSQTGFNLSIPRVLTVMSHLGRTSVLSYLRLLRFRVNSRVSTVDILGRTLQRTDHVCMRLTKVKTGVNCLSINNNLTMSCSNSRADFCTSGGCDARGCTGSIITRIRRTYQRGNVPIPALIDRDKQTVTSRRSILIFSILNDDSTPSRSRLRVPGRSSRIVLQRLCRVRRGLAPGAIRRLCGSTLRFGRRSVDLFGFNCLDLTRQTGTRQLC